MRHGLHKLTDGQTDGQVRRKEKPQTTNQLKKNVVMPRGRKRKIAEFIPRPWIHNSSSEDEHLEDQVPEPQHGGMFYIIIYFIFNYLFITEKLEKNRYFLFNIFFK